MQWNKLSVSDKAALMRIYIENGITDLDVMQAHYNQQGGKVGRNSNSANSHSSLPNNSRTYERWADTRSQQNGSYLYQTGEDVNDDKPTPDLGPNSTRMNQIGAWLATQPMSNLSNVDTKIRFGLTPEQQIFKRESERAQAVENERKNKARQQADQKLRDDLSGKNGFWIALSTALQRAGDPLTSGGPSIIADDANRLEAVGLEDEANRLRALSTAIGVAGLSMYTMPTLVGNATNIALQGSKTALGAAGKMMLPSTWSAAAGLSSGFGAGLDAAMFSGMAVNAGKELTTGSNWQPGGRYNNDNWGGFQGGANLLLDATMLAPVFDVAKAGVKLVGNAANAIRNNRLINFYTMHPINKISHLSTSNKIYNLTQSGLKFIEPITINEQRNNIFNNVSKLKIKNGEAFQTDGSILFRPKGNNDNWSLMHELGHVFDENNIFSGLVAEKMPSSYKYGIKVNPDKDFREFWADLFASNNTEKPFDYLKNFNIKERFDLTQGIDIFNKPKLLPQKTRRSLQEIENEYAIEVAKRPEDRDYTKLNNLRQEHFKTVASSPILDTEGRPLHLFHSGDRVPEFTQFDTNIEGTQSYIYTASNPKASKTYIQYYHNPREQKLQETLDSLIKESNDYDSEHLESLFKPEAERNIEDIMFYKKHDEYIKKIQELLDELKSVDRYEGSEKLTHDLYANSPTLQTFEGNGSLWNEIPSPDYINYGIGPKKLSTRDIEKILKKEKGFDFRVTDIYDNGTTVEANNINSYLTDVYAFKHPESLKLADPITYDDAGNIIPLSERDNFLSKDLRYMLPWGIVLGSGVGVGINYSK